MKVEENLAESKQINIGLLQGSVLSPILFVLYINDIKKVLQLATVNLFADDAALSIAEKDPADAYQEFENQNDKNLKMESVRVVLELCPASLHESNELNLFKIPLNS